MTCHDDSRPAGPAPGTRPRPAAPRGDHASEPAPVAGPVLGSVSVWACGQRARATQRGERYTAGAREHPASTLPDLAGYAISCFTEPGDWVLDPMCGIGTTLVEAVTRGRRALGIEVDPRWSEVAQACLTGLRRRGIGGQAHIVTGDARQVDPLLGEQLAGRVALLFCAPPYGPIHTPPATSPGRQAWAPGPAPLDRHRMRATLSQVLRGCRGWLRPGGHVVLTTRAWRTPGGELLDLSADVLAAAQHAGLIPRRRCVALLARLAPPGQLYPRASATHQSHITRLRAGGVPAVVLAHHDIYLFTTPEHPPPTPSCPPTALTADPRLVRSTA